MKAAVLSAHIGGRINAIASKSQAHRLLICSALSGSDTSVNCPDSSEDIEATAACLNSLCARVARVPSGYATSPSGISEYMTERVLNCGESGSTYRFLLPVACALGLPSRFILGGRLPERPMEVFWNVLEEHGAVIGAKGTSELSVGGALRPGRYTLPGSISSQYISGLIFALPMLDSDSVIVITSAAESKSYISLTLEAVRSFGIKAYWRDNTISIPGGQKYISPGSVTVEGDWSNSAFWLCAAAAGGSGLTCLGLSADSKQGDRAVLELLSRFGADISAGKSSVTVNPGGRLKGIEIDAGEIPDLVPALSVAAASADGATIIKNAGRLRFKESDRLLSVGRTLKLLGANAAQRDDMLIISGRRTLAGGTTDSFGDHRIAMMAAVAAVICTGPVIIERAQAVAKSYPKFFEDFCALGAKVEITEV